MYMRLTDFVASLNAPANVRFPLRVKLVLSAPVPAYILESASPFCRRKEGGLV
jgi:hypothetical protein